MLEACPFKGTPMTTSCDGASQMGECKSWTLDWTMDWTMDWNMDSILDSFTSQGLDQEQCWG